MDLQTVLLTHARQYPLMEPTDAVKLLYQNEFGGGHLIRNPDSCLAFLRREYDSVSPCANLPLSEDIGNGMLRVNLGSLDYHHLSLSGLGEIFLQSAARQSGSLDSFQDKLRVLEALTDAGQMPFSREILDAYLTTYRQAGFPMVSHSETYRSAYHPAYRVVRQEILSDHLKQVP